MMFHVKQWTKVVVALCITVVLLFSCIKKKEQAILDKPDVRYAIYKIGSAGNVSRETRSDLPKKKFL